MAGPFGAPATRGRANAEMQNANPGWVGATSTLARAVGGPQARIQRDSWYARWMAWVKVPAEHHPLFRAALPTDRRVTTMPLFGGVAAKVNGHIFAGLFGRSVIVALPEPDRTEALALDGAGPFDPMGDGRAMSQKVMLPESMMDEPAELKAWIARAFALSAALPPKAVKPKKRAAAKKAPAAKKAAAKTKAAAAKNAPAAKKRPATKKAKRPAARR